MLAHGGAAGRVMLVGIAAVLAVGACGEDAGPDDAVEPVDTPPVETPVDDSPEAVAIADLSAHAGVGAAAIEVVAHEQVTWRDGSLGCPQPGESYIQALVEGYRIVLRAEGEEFSYHGASDEPPERCDDPDPDGTIDDSAAGTGEDGDARGSEDDNAGAKPTTPPAEPPQEDDMTDQDGPVAEAIALLANDTGADPADVEVVAHQDVTWRNGSLGCPRPGMMYTQALVEGYRIVLRAQGAEVAYHGAHGQPPFRCDDPDPNGAAGTRPKQ